MPYNLLKNKKGIIFGALDNKSIAWKVAELVREEGGEIILTNAPVALRMGQINKLGEQLDSPVIPADATDISELENLTQKALDHFKGKFDFVLHSIGMSINVRKKDIIQTKIMTGPKKVGIFQPFHFISYSKFCTRKTH